mmetsp:Transcript_1010/g.3431  ORF Transcript_1010/g.3431 Transcript_1010/m.3431 type:complete len:289 (+) Transcript_1010:127-993(+)
MSSSTFTAAERSARPSFEVVQSMCALSALVYNEGVGRMLHPEDVETDGEVTKEALAQIRSRSPKGHVVKPITRAKSSLDCGVLLSEAQERVTVVFRGSLQLKDWLVDLAFLKTADDGARVHGGFHFQLHYDGAMEEITKEVKLLLAKHPTYDVYCTGHSLGGALSSLCAFELSFALPHTKIYNYSFASPRVGGVAWRDKFNARPNVFHVRVCNSSDTVTAVPTINFHHVGDWVIVLNTDHGHQPTFYTRTAPYNHLTAFAFWTNLMPWRHLMASYWENLKGNEWPDDE